MASKVVDWPEDIADVLCSASAIDRINEVISDLWGGGEGSPWVIAQEVRLECMKIIREGVAEHKKLNPDGVAPDTSINYRINTDENTGR